MKSKIVRRGLACIGSVAMVVGIGVVMAGPASGFANSQEFEINGFAIKRIVKHTNPTITRVNIVRGDKIMIVSEFELANNVQGVPVGGLTEFYDPCLKFETGTATARTGFNSLPMTVQEAPGQLQMKFATSLVYSTTTRVQAEFLVGDTCKYDTPFNVGMSLKAPNASELLGRQSLGDSVQFNRHQRRIETSGNIDVYPDRKNAFFSATGFTWIDPGETVAFRVNGQLLCEGSYGALYDYGDPAQCSAAINLPDGAYTYEANLPESNTAASVTRRSALTVWRNSTTVLSAPAGTWAGRATTLTAAVSPAGNGGTVEFSNGAVVLGTSPVDPSGNATYSWVPAAGGPQTITAKYSGGTYTQASERALTIDVGITGSTTTLSASADPRVGQAATLTADVSPTGAGGAVEFSNGAVVLGSSPVADNGKATLPWVPTAAGSQTITAKFSGRPGVAASIPAPLTVNVLPLLESTTVLSASARPWVGRTATLTAAISPGGAGGTVEFSNGTVVLGSSPVEANGTATYSWAPTAAGDQTITARFSGRPGMSGSQHSLPLSVGEDTLSTTALSASATPWVGRTTTLTAAVTAAGTGGTVEFSNGTVVLGSSPVEANGTATFSWAPTAAGNQTITAKFSGRADVQSSEASLPVSVGEDAVSRTRLSIAGNPWVGVANTLTADVSPVGDGGTVEFSNGAVVLGTVVVDANGKATLPWVPTAAGSQTITAKFSGGTDVKASEESLALNVGIVADSTTTLTVELNPWGELAATLTARVSPAVEGGTVEFSNGSVVLGTVNVGRSGVAVYSWSPVELGAHTVTATFSGRDGVRSSADSKVVSMGGTQTATVLSVGGAPVVGKPSTLTARVDAPGAAGTITFKDGDIDLGWAPVESDGSTTFTWTPTTSGKRTLTAEYSGSSGSTAFRPSTGTLDVQIGEGEGGGGGAGSLGNIFGSLGS